MKRHSPSLILALLLLVADQLTKLLIVRSIPLYESSCVIPGFFDLTHIRNRGAIFGFLNQSDSELIRFGLLAASLFALVFILVYFFRTPPTEKSLKLALTLILAGATGNMADRIIKGYVVDFLDFYAGGWHFPSFNVADSCITCGAALLLFVFFFRKG
ncbi:MAG: signal peptidase II [Acidobacteria bacterium]|nr:signal peptidase II [Acidobacteriota bacterium]MBU1473260.1 signal peptidase II [Acidobacteriota bacterium]